MGDSIVVIHESQELREQTQCYLETAGFFVAGARELATAESHLAEMAPSLLLLQWIGGDQTEASIGDLKSGQDTRASRIVVLAKEDEISEAIVSLEYGADDCLAIPFTAKELVGRVNACFRRPPTVTRRDRVRAGPLLLDRVAHRLFVSDEYVPIAPSEFRLMEFFIEHCGRAFSRQELLQHAWPRNVRAGRRTVDVNVRRLRQALEPFGYEHLIQTVRGYGYRFSLEDRDAGNRSVAAGTFYSMP